MAVLKGGKAQGLERLKSLGLKVPAYLEWEMPPDYREEEGREIPAELLVVLKEQLGFPEKPIIVRSNAAHEDGRQHSFAGIFESVPGVKKPEELKPAIDRVLGSYHSERAKTYCKQAGLPEITEPLLLFQTHIEPEYSGVAFSTFPEYPDELAVHYTEGHSEKMIQGEESGRALYWDKLQHGPVEENAELPVFTWDLVTGLLTLERSMGHPVDVEFGYAGGELFYFQVRPLSQPIAERIVLDNSNIQESYAGISLPLTFSFASKAYEEVYRQTMHTMRLSDERSWSMKEC